LGKIKVKNNQNPMSEVRADLEDFALAETKIANTESIKK
jgi:hypothetical protein